MIVFRVNGGGPRRPVARIGDDHQCPKRNDDGSAHKGGPVVTGSPTMKANGRPVARVGDKVHCDGSTDTIIKGIDNLLVDGKPIAVQGSKCAHGGVIVEGSPNVFVEEYTDEHKAEHFARMRAMGIDVDEHWIQGQYLDGDGNGVYGMPYRIIHEDGTEANGTLDHDGKTAKMQYLSQGTATIHFGDRPGLEEELQDERKQLKKYLDNILAKTRAYAQAHPDKIADENEYEQLYTENLAFARGLGMGAVKLVKGTASGVAHLFKIAAMDVRESVDTIDGDNKDYNKVSRQETAQGQAIVTTIEKGKHLLELVYEDQPTRDMLEKFAQDYYLSETPMMIAKEAGEAAGGLIPGILVALMLGSPELVPAEVASEAGADISGVAAVANRMARTLKELKETKDVEQAEVDQLHVIDQRKKVAFDFYLKSGYSPEKALEHMDGIDFTNPVNVVGLQKGEEVVQWQIEGGAQGNYYSLHGVVPEELGINPQGVLRETGQVTSKLQRYYVVHRPTEALKSISKAITDVWSVPGKPFIAPGGGVQFMSTDKGAFEEVMK